MGQGVCSGTHRLADKMKKGRAVAVERAHQASERDMFGWETIRIIELDHQLASLWRLIFGSRLSSYQRGPGFSDLV